MRIVFTQRMKDSLYHIWQLKASERDMEYIGSIKKENRTWIIHLIDSMDTETNQKMIMNSFYAQTMKSTLT